MGTATQQKQIRLTLEDALNLEIYDEIFKIGTTQPLTVTNIYFVIDGRKDAVELTDLTPEEKATSRKILISTEDRSMHEEYYLPSSQYSRTPAPIKQ